MAKAKTITPDGKVKDLPRFDARDWEHIAENVLQEFEDRQKRRSGREKHWADIDRQVAMIPDNTFKKLPNGQLDPDKFWMAEMEPPFQAQALEVSTADARRFMFAEGAPWFRAHAEMTDEYLANTTFSSLVLGDRAEVPSEIDQDNVDKLVEGFVSHIHRQYDYVTRWDRVNAEAFKYGMGVGRMRMQSKNIYIHEASGVRKERQRLPVFVPVSIKNLYLDDPKPSMHSATELGPAHIACDRIKLENLKLAANRGSNDPNDEDGGWMPQNVKDLVPDKDDCVTVLEMEGDIVIPRKTVRSLVLPGAIVTVVKGGKEKGGDVTRSVIRFRWRKRPYSSYLLCPYHYEGADDVYPTSPLEKGRPLQIMIAESFNGFLDSASLKKAPPIGYDRTDPVFAAMGGPKIHPYALWGTADPQALQVFDRVGGDPAALAQAMTLTINLYAELTGVLPARLGAQTVSHTTAFAKDAELTRGAVRTVDYVKATGNGPLTRSLFMTYDMARDAIGRGERPSFYIDAYGGFVQVKKDNLPEKSSFEWFGSGGPAEEQEKQQRKLQSLQLSIQMDQLRIQTEQAGVETTIDFDAAIKQTLRDGGWTDVDVITKDVRAVSAGAPAAPNPGAQSVALQQLGLAGEVA